ncbi:MAG: thermonuclease family protein [Ignavibacteria bacterium]|nr:thermonuclease family protein [Ignavibacteria bacterium]
MKSLIKLTFKSVFTIGVIIILLYFGWKYIYPKLENRDSHNKKSFLVTKVFDGDTFEAEINGKPEKIRMLGIDTPEKWDSDKFERDKERSGKDKELLRKLGELSSDFTARLIGGKKVILLPDSKSDDKDKYGRLLRYVYLEDGTFVNLKIVEEGYANAYRKFNTSKKNEFIEAENEARENKKGLWGDINGKNFFDNRDK